MDFLWIIGNVTLRDVVDLALVTLLFFGLSFLFRGTQAVALLRGTLLVLIGLIIISSVFQLRALRWLLGNSLTVAAIAIPVIFQPELRRALERLGRAGTLQAALNPRVADARTSKLIEDVCTAAERLSERRHGALIVLERNGSLNDYMRSGVMLDSEVSAELLLTVFWPKTELHDGAAIVDRDGRLAAAAAVLPLSAARNLVTPTTQKRQGTRHRAALGISEVSDAVCVVVSEESGRISLAQGGHLTGRIDGKRLRQMLYAIFAPQDAGRGWLAWLRARLPRQRTTTPTVDRRS